MAAVVVLREDAPAASSPSASDTPGAAALADELRAHVAAHLARFKVPKAISFSTEPLPRTASGKLLRRQLR